MPAESRDPSGYLTNPPSTVVKVVGTARNDINGLTGIAISYNLEKQRYLVHMTASQSTMALKQENLVKASMMESYQAQWQQLQNDPRVREKMGHYLNLGRQYVAPLKLGHVVAGVVLVWIAMIFLVGFTKTLMTTSMVILLLVMAGPDLVNRSSMQVVVQHFPDRARQLIEQQLPFLKGRLSNRMAVGLVILMVALCIHSLLFAGSSKPGKTTSVKVVEPPAPILLDRATLTKFYDLGFDDAKQGAVHGTSLWEELSALKLLNSPEQDASEESLKQDYYDEDPLAHLDTISTSPPPPTQRQSFLSKLTNMTNIMSIFYLYRNLVEIGTDQSTNLFSIGQLGANLQHHTEWWKQVLLGLSLYNVVRIFL